MMQVVSWQAALVNPVSCRACYLDETLTRWPAHGAAQHTEWAILAEWWMIKKHKLIGATDLLLYYMYRHRSKIHKRSCCRFPD